MGISDVSQDQGGETRWRFGCRECRHDFVVLTDAGTAQFDVVLCPACGSQSWDVRLDPPRSWHMEDGRSERGEIKAVMRAIRDEPTDHPFARAEAAIAALDAVRSSGSAAQNHEEAVAALNEALPYKPMVNEWDLDSPDPSPQGEDHEAGKALLARIEEAAADGRLPAMLNMGPLAESHPLYRVWVAMERVRLSRVSSPAPTGGTQGEDHAEILNGPEDYPSYSQGEDHEAEVARIIERWCKRDMPTAHDCAAQILAYLSRCPSPVSGTEPDTARLVEALEAIARLTNGELIHDPTLASALANDALSGFSGPQEPQGGLDAMNDASKEKQ